MRVCACGLSAWCHQPAQSARATQNPDELQEATEARPGLIGTLNSNACVCVGVCVGPCVARQVGVNPIRLGRFKRWRPGAPKPVTSAHPVAANVPEVPTNIPISPHSRLFPSPLTGLKSPSSTGTSLLDLVKSGALTGITSCDLTPGRG